ncbi:MAG: DHA2 family efflux MFS transporter permease subunit [Ilumatobacteraceae bacterium]
MTSLEPPMTHAQAAFDRHGRLTLAIASLATLATFLDTTILFVAFPDISSTFDAASPSTLSWVLNAYTIVFAALLIPAGKISDRLGHRRTFLAGSVAFTVASMACGLAPTIEILIAFRILQAAGAAMLIPSSLALVMRAFPGDKVPHAVAIWGAAGGVAGALGPTLGATIVEHLDWRWAFFINLPIGLFTVVAGARTLRESSDPETRIPAPIGVGLIIVTASALSYGFVGSETNGWLSARTIGAFAIGLAALGVFIVHQRSSRAPVLDLDLFGIGNFRWGNLAMLVFGVAFSAMFFGSIIFLTSVWEWSILKAGFGIAPGPALVALLAPRMGKLAGTIGQRPIIVVGGLLYAAGGLWRLMLLGPDVDYWVHYFPSMILTGLGVAFCIPQLSSVVAQALPANRIGVGGAALQAVRQFGGTFGVAITIALLAAPDGLSGALDAFDKIWWIVVLGGIIVTLTSIPLRTGRQAAPAPAAAIGEVNEVTA